MTHGSSFGTLTIVTDGFNGFGVAQPFVTMVFVGQGSLVKQWNFFNGSLRSSKKVIGRLKRVGVFDFE